MKQDNEPLTVGDRVQHRKIASLQGTVHSFDLRDQVLVAWDDEDPEDPADSCSVPRRLLKKIPC